MPQPKHFLKVGGVQILTVEGDAPPVVEADPGRALTWDAHLAREGDDGGGALLKADDGALAPLVRRRRKTQPENHAGRVQQRDGLRECDEQRHSTTVSFTQLYSNSNGQLPRVFF